MYPAKDARRQFAPVRSVQTRRTQLFEIVIKPFDKLLRVRYKLSLNVIHAVTQFISIWFE